MTRPWIAAALITPFLVLPGGAMAQAPVHMCSGIGLDAAEEAAAFSHNLKLVYAQTDGSYLGGIATRISQGDTVVVEQTCPGPWLLASLPAGRYDISATLDGVEQTVSVQVGSSPREQVIRF